MNETTVNALLSRMDALAAKLGTTSGQIFEIYIQQARLAGWTDVGLAIFLLLGIIGCGYLVRKDFKGETDLDGVGIMIGVVVGGVMLASLLVVVCAIPTEFLNPKFWALEEIGKLIRAK